MVLLTGLLSSALMDSIISQCTASQTMILNVNMLGSGMSNGAFCDGMAPWLSSINTVGSGKVTLRSVSNFLSHVTSCVAKLSTTYICYARNFIRRDFYGRVCYNT